MEAVCNMFYIPLVIKFILHLVPTERHGEYAICLGRGPSLTNTGWHHVAAVYNGSNCYTYVDGVNVAAPAASGSIHTNSGNLLIGTQPNGSGTWGAGTANGSIDELRISSTARSADEIAEAYRAGRDHRISKTITSTNLSTATKLPFYVASDRPGTFMEATVGESPFANYEPDANTVGLWHLEEAAGSGAYLKDSSGRGKQFFYCGRFSHFSPR